MYFTFFKDSLPKLGSYNYGYFRPYWLDKWSDFILGKKKLALDVQGLEKLPTSHIFHTHKGNKLSVCVLAS